MLRPPDFFWPLFSNRDPRATLSPALLASRDLIFTTLEGALAGARGGLYRGAETALAEAAHLRVPIILVSALTRAQIEPLRGKLELGHPFISESGGGIFFPDGYFNIRIAGAERTGRYLAVRLGIPYVEVVEALEELARETGVGVTGFRHMSLKEIAENTGLRPRDAEAARDREFSELFFFTQADEAGIARFVAAARGKNLELCSGTPFWQISSGCNAARAVQLVAKIYREATRTNLRTVGIGAEASHLAWLRVMDKAILLPQPDGAPDPALSAGLAHFVLAGSPGAEGWNSAVLQVLGRT